MKLFTFPARRPRRRHSICSPIGFSLLVTLGFPCIAAEATDRTAAPDTAISYRMDASGWTMAQPVGWVGKTGGAATFARDEGMPNGTMTLNEGLAVLNAGSFSTGQIDFDVKPLGYDDAGIIFHRRGEEDGEFVYVRANPDCPAALDCVQYAPITHRLMGWNIYPNYQGPAPISATGWNHVTIQVADGRMAVYFNHATEPSIAVARLLGLAQDGGIAFKGPAVYANLVVHPDARPDLGKIVAQPSVPGTVTAWLAAPPTVRDRSSPVSASEIPSSTAWHPIDVEPSGLVNFGRAFGAARAPALSTAWLRMAIVASAPMRTVLHVGFAIQGSVFLNGRLVYSGNNPYYPSKDRLSPGGRIAFDNASVPLDLHRGRNEVVLAVGNDWRADEPTARLSHYGWAAEARLDPEEGLDVR